MKKAKQNPKNNDVAQLKYNIVFRVSLPLDESKIEQDTSAIVDHVISGLEIVSADVKGIELEQLQYYGSEPVRIPIIERAENNG